MLPPPLKTWWIWRLPSMPNMFGLETIIDAIFGGCSSALLMLQIDQWSVNCNRRQQFTAGNHYRMRTKMWDEMLTNVNMCFLATYRFLIRCLHLLNCLSLATTFIQKSVAHFPQLKHTPYCVQSLNQIAALCLWLDGDLEKLMNNTILGVPLSVLLMLQFL